MSRAIQEYLRERVARKQLECIHTGSDGRIFGGIAEEWKSLTSILESESGAELWFFRSPEETWHNPMGMEGYAVVKVGTVIDFLITALS